MQCGGDQRTGLNGFLERRVLAVRKSLVSGYLVVALLYPCFQQGLEERLSRKRLHEKQLHFRKITQRTGNTEMVEQVRLAQSLSEGRDDVHRHAAQPVRVHLSIYSYLLRSLCFRLYAINGIAQNTAFVTSIMSQILVHLLHGERTRQNLRQGFRQQAGDFDGVCCIHEGGNESVDGVDGETHIEMFENRDRSGKW